MIIKVNDRKEIDFFDNNGNYCSTIHGEIKKVEQLSQDFCRITVEQTMYANRVIVKENEKQGLQRQRWLQNLELITWYSDF